ncbi:MAG: sporulation protein YunB [Clostridia bacterium]|nr:sporulation protein YunB [Clostridia bacterium]MDD4685677.1 sporulation protein YunB [Clostridia bacterium]
MKSWKGKKRLSLRAKAIIILCFFLCFIVLSILYLANIVNPVIYQATEAQIKSSAQKALSSAVYSIVSSNTDTYSDIINYTYNDKGAVSLIKVNSYYVNILSRKIAALAQGNIDNVVNSGINVHLGAFSGITVLVNLGPSVTMDLNSIGTVTTIFRSEFLNAGINQTNHRIYVNIKSSVCVVLPIYSPTIETETEILIGETIIVGEVPSTYLQSSYLDEMLNLVPH